MGNKPKILIRATEKSQEYAISLKNKMNDWASSEIWTEKFSSEKTEKLPLSVLERNISDFDKCVFLLMPDDIIKTSKDEIRLQESNLILDILLSYNYVGKISTIVVLPKNSIAFDLLRVVSWVNHDFSQPADKLAENLEKFIFDAKIVGIGKPRMINKLSIAKLEHSKQSAEDDNSNWDDIRTPDPVTKSQITWEDNVDFVSEMSAPPLSDSFIFNAADGKE